VHVAQEGRRPAATQNVRGSKHVQIGFSPTASRIARSSSRCSTIGEGLGGRRSETEPELGFPETTGLEKIALFP